MSSATALTALRAFVLDQIERTDERVDALADGLSPTIGTFRPDGAANTVYWLLWHQARVLDDHGAALAGRPQTWTEDGWYDRFGLPFSPSATGFGQSPDEVAEVVADADLLAGYHHAATAALRPYVEGLDTTELARIVDTRWDPPVTASVRIVSMLGDSLQHLGQAAYVRGLAERAGLG